jgi:molybdopterin molybdotransferase
MISYQDALSKIEAAAPVLPAKELALLDALDRILAEDVVSTVDSPAFNNSSMDGFAVRASDLEDADKRNPVDLKVVETIHAGTMPSKKVGLGQAAKIMTGAPMPAGANAVVRVEDTRQLGNTVWISFCPAPGAYVRRQGEEFKAGGKVLGAGVSLRPYEIGILAALGYSRIRVGGLPRVAFFTTGDELAGPSEPLRPGQIRDVNSHTLACLLRRSGCSFENLGCVADEIEPLKAAIQKGLQNADVLITSGAISMGEKDYLGKCMKDLGIEEIFYKANIKPGKPVWFGKKNGKIVFCLPGNPVSTMVIFLLLVRPALLRMQGCADIRPRSILARCGVSIEREDTREEFMRAALKAMETETHAFPSPLQGSSIMTSFVSAEGLMAIPANVTSLQLGDPVEVFLLE